MIGISQRIGFEEPLVARETDACDASFAALVARQSRFVFRVAYSVLRNVHDAEDAVQETFLKLFRSRGWDGIENEKAFLARAAWRVAVDRRAKVKTEEPNAEIAAGGRNPEQAAIAQDWSAIVRRLIDALPEDLRRTLALYSVDEMSSREIAGIMGIPEATVRGRLMRARQILKQKLAAYGK